MKKIVIFDTTLRDGEQSPGASMAAGDKAAIARQLEKLNVDVIEAGFPVASKGDFEAVKRISSEVSKPIVAALCRSKKHDIDCAFRAIEASRRQRLHIFLATSAIHMRFKLKKTPREIIEAAASAVKYAKNFCRDIEFSPEDASRTKPEFLFKVIEKAISAGATTINIPDTVGYSMPGEFGALIKSIAENVPNIENASISAHCHDDLGLAVANSLSAIQNGAMQVECTINGIGERAGNAALEEIAIALETRKDIFLAETQLDISRIFETSRLVSRLAGLPVQRNKAIVGENAFAHEAGIHQHGMLCNSSTYEIISPAKIGRKTEFVLGKHSGKHALGFEMARLGFKPTEPQLEEVSKKIKAFADEHKRLGKKELLSIIRKCRVKN